ncbi:twin-arginine translocase TatA/TatE family subunit [Bacteroidota bacterium]
MIHYLLFIGGWEILVVMVIVLMLFGAKKIPEIARGLGKGLKEFKKITNEIKTEFDKETEVLDDIKDIKKDITEKSDIAKDLKEIKKNINK